MVASGKRPARDTGVERCAVRCIRGQLNHIGLSIRAFLRLEYHRITSRISWFHAKTEICREAVRKYLLNPLFQLPKMATIRRKIITTEKAPVPVVPLR